MSDTPRTDAVCTEIGKLGYSLRLGQITLPQFAKLAQEQLDKCGNVERELNAANERIKRLENIFSYAVNGASNAFDEAGIKPGEFVDRAKFAKERIKRLEAAGDAMDPHGDADCDCIPGDIVLCKHCHSASLNWQKAKQPIS